MKWDSKILPFVRNACATDIYKIFSKSILLSFNILEESRNIDRIIQRIYAQSSNKHAWKDVRRPTYILSYGNNVCSVMLYCCSTALHASKMSLSYVQTNLYLAVLIFLTHFTHIWSTYTHIFYLPIENM